MKLIMAAWWKLSSKFLVVEIANKLAGTVTAMHLFGDSLRNDLPMDI